MLISESDTVWASFTTPAKGAIEETVDRSHGMVRARCCHNLTDTTKTQRHIFRN